MSDEFETLLAHHSSLITHHLIVMTDNVFKDGILAGRVAFVTGGGTGITGGVARALAEAGARVALVSRKLEHLEPAAAKINEAGGEALALAAGVRDQRADQ